MRPALLPLLLPTIILACAQPAPPAPQHTVTVTAPSASAASPTASSVAEVHRQSCIPEQYRKGWVSDVFEYNSHPVFCLAVSDKDQSCWISQPEGLSHGSARIRPAAWPRKSSSGTHSIDSNATSVKVCAASNDKQCSTISPKGFAGADQSEFPSEIAWHIPADTNADGTRLMLVRHEGKRSEKVFVETYETGSGKRLGRIPIHADQFVSQVDWIGRLALLTICVEEGPGCSAAVFDPDTGKLMPPGAGINVYGIENPVHRAAGDSWAVLQTDGSRLTFVNFSTGAVEAELPTGLAADIESGVEAVRIGPDRLAIISGAPTAGDLVVVDLATRKIAARFSAPTCPASR